MSVLVDSDILIEVSRGRDADTLACWGLLSDSSEPILYSPVSSAELWAGARPREHALLEGLFGALLCVPVNEEIGRAAGELLRLYAKSHGLEIGDAMIAASAMDRDAALWTRNRKHYPMRGLRFHNAVPS
ncbi:MAG: type II toxin-antitoxin system VapC family toxin [Acidobacteria bacterium]|nr:type II toxin-antitoxin system VapC family toxin [Acidobacteriota bacterium]